MQAETNIEAVTLKLLLEKTENHVSFKNDILQMTQKHKHCLHQELHLMFSIITKTHTLMHKCFDKTSKCVSFGQSLQIGHTKSSPKWKDWKMKMCHCCSHPLNKDEQRTVASQTNNQMMWVCMPWIEEAEGLGCTLRLFFSHHQSVTATILLALGNGQTVPF